MMLFKKILPPLVAFILGVILTYVLMSMHLAMERSAGQAKLKQYEIDALRAIYEQNEIEAQQKEKKHWFQELEEKKAAEAEMRTKEQHSQGDALKSQFDQFSD